MARATFQVACVVLVLLTSNELIDAQLHDQSFPDRLDRMHYDRELTSIIKLKQGAIQGLVLRPKAGRELGEVEVFLGIPYAAPPVDGLRFMPPGAAAHWNDVKMMTSFAPVCPQTLPELRRDSASEGRYNYLKRLYPFLTNESEDCLYLNIYAPSRGNTRSTNETFPVMIFIHGESYEWNSGNPYDGSVLAAYGKIIVITINYRLGRLGFMRLTDNGHTIGNFGLLDQIAVLQWVKENIGKFNGDPNSVTLAGHGTGAASVNFLMASHVAHGFFNRSILMSGSALSDMALTSRSDSEHITVQVAQSLNCLSLTELPECLRKRKLSDIKGVSVLAPNYTTPFGPIVDHQVIPNEPAQVMKVYKDLYSKYDLLYGCTETESYHWLGQRLLSQGMLESERSEFLKYYTQARFKYGSGQALVEILKKYGPMQKEYGSNSDAQSNRDMVLDVLSDARVAAPLVQTADFHSNANPNSYFYVFGHKSQYGEYADLNKSVHGEELAYIFGVPLGAYKNHFLKDYIPREKLLSEALMTYWSNFVKTGNPNTPKKYYYMTGDAKDWRKFDVNWPKYNQYSQSYLYLETPPAMRYRYRQKYMKFWNQDLPDLLNNTNNFAPKPKPHLKKDDRDYTENVFPRFKDDYGRYSPYPRGTDAKATREDPLRVLSKMDRPNRPMPAGVVDGLRRWDQSVEEMPSILVSTLTTEKPKEKEIESNDIIQQSALTMNLIIAAGVLFFLINLLIFVILYYFKSRLKSREREIKRFGINRDFPDGDEHIYDKETKEDEVGSGCGMLKAVRNSGKKSEDFYEPVKNHVYDGSKTPKSDDSGGFGQRFKLRRQMSSSTLDAHTKVRDWIAHEIVQRCSPSLLRKSNDAKEQEPKFLSNGNVINLPIHKDRIPTDLPKPNCQIGSLTGSLKATTESTLSIGTHEKQNSMKNIADVNKKNIKNKTESAKSSKPSIQSASSKSAKNKHRRNISEGSIQKPKPQKVSVAVDATPATRSSSVLKQQPIELSKSLDYCFYDDQIVRCTTPLRRSQTVEDIIKRSSTDSLPSSNENLFKSTVDLELEPEKPCEIIKIVHKHSASDPVKDVNYTQMFGNIPYKFNTFNTIQPPVAFRNDINVTSRDEKRSSPMSPSEALMTIKRRNFPKVLPDYPKPGDIMPSLAQKRMSLPPQCNLHLLLNSVNSSPSNSEVSTPTELKTFARGPPIPPPRSSSTLGRNADSYRNYERMNSFDCPNENYVEMHSNTLPNIKRLNDPDNSYYTQIKNKPKINMIELERNGSFSESDREDGISKENAYYEAVRPQPKLIISADPIDPLIVNDGKVIIRPTINRNPPIKNTNIPRVLATDNSVESIEKCYHTNSLPPPVQPAKFNPIKPGKSNDYKIEIPVYRPDTKGPPTAEELERSRVQQEKAKDAKSNSLTRRDSGKKGPDIKHDAKNQSKSTEKRHVTAGVKRSDSSSKIPKTPVMPAKGRKDQKSSPKAVRSKPQLKPAVKGSSIPQPVPAQKITNELHDIGKSMSESSNDTECSTETVKNIK